MLELVVVLLVLGLAAAAVAPSLRRFSRSWQTIDAASDLLAMTRLAQATAAASGQPCRLNVDAAAGSYWLTQRVRGAYLRPATEAGRTCNMPDDTTLSWDAATDSSARGYVEFTSDGGHEEASFRVEGPSGDAVRVVADSAGESFRMVDLNTRREVR